MTETELFRAMGMDKPLVQGSPEWLAARRELVTSTDLPVLLGLSPYKSEATLAREKGGAEPVEQTLVMRVGLALEPLLASEYERATGAKLRRYHGLVTHPQIEWAAASPDWRRVGARYLVEGKTSQAKRWDDDELPQDVEAQVRWALGVTGYPVADVVALLHGRELRIYTVEHDTPTFDNLVAIATDFRRRLAAGGPFTENAASVKARYPADDGTELQADEAIEEAVLELLRLRAQSKDIDTACEAIETAVKARMADAARLVGKGWSVTWKRTKDVTLTDWKLIADGLLRQLPEDQRDALVSVQTMVRPGPRPFRLSVEKGA